MEIVLLIIGIIIGTVVGYLAADRKSAALRAEISGTKKEIELLKLQKEEAEALHKRMNTEFENLSNRIFQSKAEDFTRLNAEHLGNLLRPLGDNLKDFRQKVEQVYSTEAKERFSLGERIKELVELNNRLSEDANNLTRALKGDSKMQGNWGEMILERLLQASGLIEGEHYFRQEFLRRTGRSHHQRGKRAEDAARHHREIPRRTGNDYRLQSVADCLCRLHLCRKQGGAGTLPESTPAICPLPHRRAQP